VCGGLALAAGLAILLISHIDQGGGIYIGFWEWRFVWWWFGYHHGSWHMSGVAWLGHQ
jgi:hypothetical protein